MVVTLALAASSTPLFACQCDDRKISVEDSASVEDLVPQGVPNPPHNPNPPRSFSGSLTMGHSERTGIYAYAGRRNAPIPGVTQRAAPTGRRPFGRRNALAPQRTGAR